MLARGKLGKKKHLLVGIALGRTPCCGGPKDEEESLGQEEGELQQIFHIRCLGNVLTGELAMSLMFRSSYLLTASTDIFISLLDPSTPSFTSFWKQYRTVSGWTLSRLMILFWC